MTFVKGYLRETIHRLVKDESGPTAVEYAIMIAMILLIAVGAISALGTSSENTFNTIGAKVPVGS